MDTPEKADDGVVPEMRSAHSPEDRAATQAVCLTNDFAGPNNESDVRIVDERLREGDWLVDAHERKKASEPALQTNTIRRAC